MGKIKEFYIFVNGGPEVNAVTSREVTGHLVLELNQDVTVNYVRINLYGKSECRWTEGSGDSSKTYTSLDVLVDTTIELVRPDGAAAVAMKAGNYTLPFSFLLNQDRHYPSSFHPSIYGKVKYVLSAKMDRKGIVFDDKAELPIQIYNPQSIDIPQLLEPASVEGEGTDGCCFSSGAIAVRASVDRTGLRLKDGELEVTLSIDNLSRSVATPKVSLVQNMLFLVKSHKRKLKAVLQILPGPPALGNTRDNVSKYLIKMEGIDTCGTISSTGNILVTYAIMIKVKGTSIKEYIPVTVGLTSQLPAAPDGIQFAPPPSYDKIQDYQ